MTMMSEGHASQVSLFVSSFSESNVLPHQSSFHFSSWLVCRLHLMSLTEVSASCGFDCTLQAGHDFGVLASAHSDSREHLYWCQEDRLWRSRIQGGGDAQLVSIVNPRQSLGSREHQEKNKACHTHQSPHYVGKQKETMVLELWS